jgi:RND family efflux transporter MFP subunit
VTVRKRASASVIAGLTLILAACSAGDRAEVQAEKAQAGAAAPVTAVMVAEAQLPRVISASGSVSAWEEVPVGAETGGLTATAVLADEGSYVRQGQPLVQMNDALLRAQLAQQQAQVQTAEANVSRDDAALARAQELKERGFLSQAALDTALANQRSSQANLAAARAALSETRTRLSQATIRAPVGGLVIRRSVTRGQIIQPGAELFRIVRDGRLELDAQVPEVELQLVRAGMAATVVSDQAGEVQGRVRIVTSEVDPQTRLGVARISLTAPGALRPGMFARASIDAGTQTALVVPIEAIVFREGKPGVYVIGAENVARFIPVTTGVRQQGQVALTSGVQAGQRVVVRGAGFLGDGDVVRVEAPARPTPAPAAAAPEAAAQ